jgi:hypothetical protein
LCVSWNKPGGVLGLIRRGLIPPKSNSFA